jgi:hypothetical protein
MDYIGRQLPVAHAGNADGRRCQLILIRKTRCQGTAEKLHVFGDGGQAYGCLCASSISASSPLSAPSSSRNT